jgi:hypothetical protein
MGNEEAGIKMFPIIHLASQFEAINRVILQYHMTREEILAWMNWYGVTGVYYDNHRWYQSHWGIVNKFDFAPDNRLLIDKREIPRS